MATAKKATDISEKIANLAAAKESEANATKALAEADGLVLSQSVNIEVAKDRTREIAHRLAGDYRNGYYEFNAGVDGASVSDLLAGLRIHERVYPTKPIIIELNTPGGSIIDGFRAFDEVLRLRKKGHHVTIRVRGEAASMGAVLLQAADKRECGPNAFIMIHRAAFGAFGKTYEVEDIAEFVKTKLEHRILQVFIERCGGDPARFSAIFDKRKDIWYTAEEALEAGLIDEIA